GRYPLPQCRADRHRHEAREREDHRDPRLRTRGLRCNMRGQPGDLERLGTMKPAERKRMVDSTIGLGVIDNVARWANDQALEKTREVETIERVCVKPVEPVAPANYRPSSEIQAQIVELTALKSEFDRLQG